MAFKISRRKERRKIWKLFVVLVKGDIHIWSSRSGNRAFEIQHNVSYSSVRRQHEKGENIIFFYSVPRNESGEQWTANLCENVCYNIIVCVYLCKFDSFIFLSGREWNGKKKKKKWTKKLWELWFHFPSNMRFHNNNNENDGYDLISPFSYRLPYASMWHDISHCYIFFGYIVFFLLLGKFLIKCDGQLCAELGC